MKPEEGPVCEDCVYFRQHYIKESDGIRVAFAQVWCGHCTCSRLKRRKQDEPACERFTPRRDDE